MQELECKRLEKCTILIDSYKLQYPQILSIQRLFPNTVCLGFKIKYFGADIHDSLWKISPKLPNILNLELENWVTVKLTMICCFPNLRYLKLTN